MGRLLTFPFNPGTVAIEPISGPISRNSGATTAQDGSEQTFDGIGDVVSLRLTFNLKRKTWARNERGLFTGMMIGGNAGRLTFYDPDMMRPSEAGLDVPPQKDWLDLQPQNWSNGQPWSNGMGWMTTPPVVPVAASAAYDTGIVSLADQHWGHRLQPGDYLGFFPFHFGLYMVWDVIDDGQYRIWPRLRKAITLSDFATLLPTIVMKATRDGVSMGRDLVTTKASSIILTEMIDPYVRTHFAE